MGYETGTWQPDPTPPVAIFNGDWRAQTDYLYEMFGDMLGCFEYYDLDNPGETLTAEQIEDDLKEATSIVIICNNQCRHCGNWDGEVEFYNDDGDLVAKTEFTD